MRRSLVALMAVALVMALAAPVGAGAEAKERPFKGEVVGAGTFDEDPELIATRCANPANTARVSTFSGWGDLTHLGYSHIVAEHCSYIEPLGTYGEGILTITADNGDILMATYGPGFSVIDPELLPIIGFEDPFEFVDGGTGRFAEADGGGYEVGWFHLGTNEFGVYMEGTIIYDASNRKNK